MNKTIEQTEYAVQQFIGFFHGKKGYDIIPLVEAMGLTGPEWEVIKEKEAELFSADNIKEIDQYFGYKSQEERFTADDEPVIEYKTGEEKYEEAFHQ